MKKEKIEITWKQIFIVIGIVFFVANWIGGPEWALGLSIFLFIGFFQIMKEQKQESNKQKLYKDLGQIHTDSKGITSDDYEEIEDPDHNLVHLPTIDTIYFEYKIKSNIYKHTVDVKEVKLNGPIKGWSHERKGIRSFLTERIKDREITRIKTGEVMKLKDWRKLAVDMKK